MLVMLTVAIALGIALVSLTLAGRWFERWDASRHVRAGSGVIAGAEPFELDADGDQGLLLLHGFGDTPQALRSLGAHLQARGYGVRAPLLPGHGRTIRVFGSSEATDWLSEAQNGLNALRERYSRVGIVGLSMGGALAVLLAAGHSDVRAMVLIAPYLSVPDRVRRITRWRHIVGRLLPYFPAFGGRSIHDDAARAENLAYGALNVHVLGELVKTVDHAISASPNVSIPVLVLQSRQDNRIPAEAAQRAFDRLGTTHKDLKWLEGCGHILTVDHQRDRVAAEATGFLDRWMSSARVEATG